MNRSNFTLKAVSLFVLVGSTGILSQGAEDSLQSPGYVAGEVIIRLKNGLTQAVEQHQEGESSLLRLRKKYGLTPSETNIKGVRNGRPRRFTLAGTARSVHDLCAELRKDGDVALVQPNYIYSLCAQPNDPEFADQYAHQLIQMSEAWDISTGSRDVVVAVLDTGVDIDHPDLRNNIWVNLGEIPNNGIDDDQNGFVDDVHGWNFEGDDNEIGPVEDPFSFFDSFANHGTMVSGVIAGEGNNNEGVAGVNWQCSIMVLRLSDGITSMEVAAALDYAAANGAHVANMSFGSDDFGPEGDPLVQEAIANAYRQGVLLVASAGNDDDTRPNYPAAYYNVMAVGSTNGLDFKTGHSSFGSWVDITAPGTDIVTTDWGGDQPYIATAGTSFSAPYVAAVGALILAHDPSLTHLDVRAILENTTDPVFYGDVPPEMGYLGTGRVNAYHGLQASEKSHPLGEIASPRIGRTLPASEDLDLALLVHGDTYVLDVSRYGRDDWSLVGQGDASVDDDGLLHLAFANPGPGAYTLRLGVTRDGRTHWDRKDFAIESVTEQTHWPKQDESDDPLSFSIYNSDPLCVDLNGDGRNEIIQSSVIVDLDSFFFDEYTGMISVWDEEGNLLPGWPQERPTYIVSSVFMAVGDIDGDGAFELVVVDDYLLTVAAYRSNGELVEGDWPIEVGYWWAFIAADPILADLDGDGASEIIIALDDESNSDDGLFALRGDGGYLWQRRYTAHGPLSVADLEGDGDVEIALCGFGPGITEVYTFLLDHDGRQIRRWRGGSPKGTVFSDLDGDGEQELLFCTAMGVQAVHSDGNVVWTASVLDSLDTLGAICVGDLDADGFREVYMTSKVERDGFIYTKVYGFNHTGEPLTEAGYPKMLIGDSYRPMPLIVDVDGDERADLVLALSRAPVTAWSADGLPTPGFPLLNPKNDWPTAATIQDLDLDGDLELMFNDEEDSFQVLDLPGQNRPETVQWGMARHDPQNTGWTTSALSLDTIEAPDEVKPGEEVRIQVRVTGPGDPSIRFNVGGLPTGATFDTGTHTLTWTPSEAQAFRTHTIHFGVTDGIRQDSRSVSITVAPDFLYFAGMETDPGWQLDGEWAWGRPSGQGSQNGDPKSGYTGDFVIGYNLRGNYANDIDPPSFATTGAINCQGFRNIRLSFQRWLGIEAPFDRATVEVSNDKQTWVTLWSTATGPVSDQTWQSVEYPVPPEVGDDQSTVYFRWGLGPTDGSVTYPGWNIDDVLVTGDKIP